MLRRMASIALFLSGLTLLGVGTSAYFDPAVGASLQVFEPDLELGDRGAGRDTEVVFRLVNNSSRPIRVLGLSSPCGGNCRLGPKRTDDPFDLPPGRSDLECFLTDIGSGSFTGQLHLFVDDGGLREIALTVRGTGVAEGAAGGEGKQ